MDYLRAVRKFPEGSSPPIPYITAAFKGFDPAAPPVFWEPLPYVVNLKIGDSFAFDLPPNSGDALHFSYLKPNYDTIFFYVNVSEIPASNNITMVVTDSLGFPLTTNFYLGNLGTELLDDTVSHYKISYLTPGGTLNNITLPPSYWAPFGSLIYAVRNPGIPVIAGARISCSISPWP